LTREAEVDSCSQRIGRIGGGWLGFGIGGLERDYLEAAAPGQAPIERAREEAARTQERKTGGGRARAAGAPAARALWPGKRTCTRETVRERVSTQERASTRERKTGGGRRRRARHLCTAAAEQLIRH